MMPLNFPADSSDKLLIDASAIINLVATGFPREIFRALPNQVLVTNVVVAEIGKGVQKGRQDSQVLNILIKHNLLTIVELDRAETELFESLVTGTASMTLDDGEASTIAYAVTNRGIAVLDERKANRICVERYPKLAVMSTVDLLRHPKVQASLGKEKLKESIVNALNIARMRVLPHQIRWIEELLGPSALSQFPSLPKSVRNK